jgi:hypothetical protein
VTDSKTREPEDGERVGNGDNGDGDGDDDDDDGDDCCQCGAVTGRASGEPRDSVLIASGTVAGGERVVIGLVTETSELGPD